MRFLLVAAALGALTAACATSSGDLAQSDNDVVSGGGCSKEKILASASGARREAIERGFAWLDANVPYSKTGSRDGYRTDCSGFVSMCWQLGSSPNTGTFYPGSQFNSTLDSFDDLLPGDGLVRRTESEGHVMLFLGWSDAAKTSACIVHQASTAKDMQFGPQAVSGLKDRGYRGIRAKKIGDAPPPRPEAKEEEKETETKPTTETPKPPTEPPKTCTPRPTTELCDAASKQGVACGSIPNGCGGTVSCDGVGTLGCKTGARCEDNACIRTCAPKPAAELCAAAKTSKGVQCGNIPDGCGDLVDCSSVTGFGCTATQECSANRCKAKSATTEERPSTEEESTEESTTSSKESGDDGEEDAESEEKSEEGKEKPEAKEVASSGCSASRSRPLGDASMLLAATTFLAALRARRRQRRA